MKITVSLPDWTGLWDCPRAWLDTAWLRWTLMLPSVAAKCYHCHFVSGLLVTHQWCSVFPVNILQVFIKNSELMPLDTKRKPPVLFLMQKNSFIITGIKNEFKPGTWDVKRNSDSWVRASRLALGLFQFRFDRLNEKRDILHLSTFKIISSKFQQLLC